MDDRQPSKRHKLAAQEMEKDLNRSSLRPRGSVGRPPHDDPPPTSSVEPATIQLLTSNETGQEASTARSVPPPEGNAAPVADAPTGLFYDGSSYSGMRGAYPEGYEHGANYGGRLPTKFNSLLVDDDEAASTAEWVYHNQRQASRMAAYWDPYGRPCPSARSNSLRTSFNGRERESQSSQALERIEGIMARMEHHMVASTPAPVASSVPHHALFNPGKFHSFHFYFELLEICSYFAVFHVFRGFTPLFCYGKIWEATLMV
jgi:hypothetical protein